MLKKQPAIGSSSQHGEGSKKYLIEAKPVTDTQEGNFELNTHNIDTTHSDKSTFQSTGKSGGITDTAKVSITYNEFLYGWSSDCGNIESKENKLILELSNSDDICNFIKTVDYKNESLIHFYYTSNKNLNLKITYLNSNNKSFSNILLHANHDFTPIDLDLTFYSDIKQIILSLELEPNTLMQIKPSL